MRFLATCLALLGAVFLITEAGGKSVPPSAGLAAAKRGDYAAAVTLWQQACNNGVFYRCTFLGLLYEKGVLVAKDDARAASFYKQACIGGHALGCAKLANLYEHGRGVAKDVARAAVLYQQACSGGYAEGCFYLGADYELGLGVTKDPEQALKYYRQALTLDPSPELAKNIQARIDGLAKAPAQ